MLVSDCVGPSMALVCRQTALEGDVSETLDNFDSSSYGQCNNTEFRYRFLRLILYYNVLVFREAIEEFAQNDQGYHKGHVQSCDLRSLDGASGFGS
uniref:Pre-mRNA-splicing factor 38 n=1 Tax=Panagrellus redivivus TaxID=6233 RepID=A0A7E4VZJ4_PANRE